MFVCTDMSLYDGGKSRNNKLNYINLLILGCKIGTNFRAVMVVNGNISTPSNVKRGCRQGDPILGYLFILVMEILALLLTKKGKIKLYKTKFGLKHFIDMSE